MKPPEPLNPMDGFEDALLASVPQPNIPEPGQGRHVSQEWVNEHAHLLTTYKGRLAYRVAVMDLVDAGLCRSCTRQLGDFLTREAVAWSTN